MFRACYPALFAFVKEAIQAAIIARVSKQDGWEPGWQIDAIIRTLAGVPPEEPFMAPPPPAPAQQAGRPKAKSVDVGAEAAKTQLDVSSQPSGGDRPASKQ
jgi:hypothetical protein